jgi:hypothetical protein
MGDEGKNTAGELLRFPHSSFDLQNRILQRRRDSCSFQEPSSNGELHCEFLFILNLLCELLQILSMIPHSKSSGSLHHFFSKLLPSCAYAGGS